jgi:cation:H+ antiporter
MLGNLLLVVAGLVLLIWGADRFVHGAAAMARNLGIAPLLIGLTVVAFATSAPEILVSVVAALPIKLESATLRREMPALLAVSLLTVSLFLDTFLSRIDGVVMLTGLVIVMVWLARLGLRSAENDPIAQDFEAEIPTDVSMIMASVWLLIGLGTLLLGAELLVDGAIGIAKYLGVSEVVIGITIVAFGTSLPELAVSLASALKGEYGLAIGNIVAGADGSFPAYLCHGCVHTRAVRHDLRLQRQRTTLSPRGLCAPDRVRHLQWLRHRAKHLAQNS